MVFFEKRHFNFMQGLALSLFLLMLMALSIKPLHIFFIHHEVIVEHDTETKFAAPTEQDCPICDFEFFLYTAQHDHSLPSVAFIPVQPEQLLKTSKVYPVYSGAVLLRAPPVMDLFL
ncbi:MAG: hypothetical protein ACP5F6_01260 [Microbacter sp.]